MHTFATTHRDGPCQKKEKTDCCWCCTASPVAVSRCISGDGWLHTASAVFLQQ